MRIRGKDFWDWASVDLHVRNHDERLPDGTFINVQVRHTAEQGTQLFLGVYRKDGPLLLEEVYDSRPGETMTQATHWAVERAKQLFGLERQLVASAKPEPLPREGSLRAR
ncbi:hypothetical protein [Pseudomonas sp. W5-01]|uniref:hypothetical protein n=1 Tax=Pseudomonas sp. W5-01 TaxID=3097454 RepID=UPI003979663D